MLNNNQNKGYLIFCLSVLLYLLIKLFFDLSVCCTSVNEASYFIHAQHFLNGKHLYEDILTVRGPLFILIYSLILKVFGFTTFSIIALHLLNTIIIVFLSITIFLLIYTFSENYIYSGLAVLIWVLIQLTPMGAWGPFEIESSFSFEAEFICVLFSLLSILLLFKQIVGSSNLFYAFLAGICSSLPITFKASGAVMSIACFVWVLYLFFFYKPFLNKNKKALILFVLGNLMVIISLLLGTFIYNQGLSSFLEVYYLFGNYHSIDSISFLITKTLNFFFKNSNSILDCISIFIFIVGLIWLFIKHTFFPVQGRNSPFYVLICIYSFGSVCAVIAPGSYGSYYYNLIWPLCSLIYVLLIEDISKIFSNKLVRGILVISICCFFICRIVGVLNSYTVILNNCILTNILFQEESFQDPVRRTSNSKRPAFLRVADLINQQLPNKNDRFYVFAFTKNHLAFSSNIYIYSKRQCSSSTVLDWLFHEKMIEPSSNKLIKSFYSEPPEIIILSKEFFLEPWQAKKLTQFFKQLTMLLQQKYHLKSTFSYYYSTVDYENYDIYEINKNR